MRVVEALAVKKCPKCGNTEIRKETGRMEGACGRGRLFFTVYACTKCGFTLASRVGGRVRWGGG